MNAVENEKALRKVMFYCIFQLYRAIKGFDILCTDSLLYNMTCWGRSSAIEDLTVDNVLINRISATLGARCSSGITGVKVGGVQLSRRAQITPGIFVHVLFRQKTFFWLCGKVVEVATVYNDNPNSYLQTFLALFTCVLAEAIHDVPDCEWYLFCIWQ